MIENKMNNIDGNYALIYKTYELNIIHLKKEINSNGACFDFETQDCFKDSRKEISTIMLDEKIFSEKEKPKRQEIRNFILDKIDLYIQLYEEYRWLFNSYDREKLALERYRQFYNLSNNMSDDDVLQKYLVESGFVNPNKYFESEFYNNIDFVSVDHHYFFYIYGCFLKLLITKNLDIDFEDVFLIKKTATFINYHLLHFVYKKIANILFEPVLESQFISFFNLKNDFIKLKIKKNQTNKIYGLIGNLYKYIEDDLKEIWLDNILKNLELQKSRYKSKNREYLNATKGDNLDYKDKIETLFDTYNKLNEI